MCSGISLNQETVNMGIKFRINSILSVLFMLFATTQVFAEDHVINAEARRFAPDIIYIQPGDNVGFTNMTSHNAVSIDSMLPEGAEPFRGNLGQNLQLTLEVEGVYAYVCEPHLGFGMVGLIIVGEPTNLEAAREAAMQLQGPYRRILGKLKKVEVSK